jgi:hypothetical protein
MGVKRRGEGDIWWGMRLRTVAMYGVFAENESKTGIHVLFSSLDIVATNDKIICK